jgi:hypothetical protein
MILHNNKTRLKVFYALSRVFVYIILLALISPNDGKVVKVPITTPNIGLTFRLTIDSCIETVSKCVWLDVRYRARDNKFS